MPFQKGHKSGMTGKKHSKNSKEKMRQTHLGVKRPGIGGNKKGFKHSKKTKIKMSNLQKGKKHFLKTLKKMSEAHKGNQHSKETKEKISAAHKGIKFSKEHKQKISKAHKGQHYINRDEKNHLWKGDNAGKMAMHTWIIRKKGKASEYKCEFSCGKQAQDWSNEKHDYKRKLNDYWALCRSCHMKYDFKYNNS